MEATAIQAWNNYFDSFMLELCETFPECVELLTLKDACEVMLEEDEHSVLNKFLTELEPHVEALTNQDEKAFFEADIDFLKQMGVEKYWTPDLEVETKSAIWNYLQQLFVMGQTIKQVPPETLRALEMYAQNMTNQWEQQDIDLNEIDLKKLSMGAMEAVMKNDPNFLQNMQNQQPQLHQQVQQLQQQVPQQLLPDDFEKMMKSLMGEQPNCVGGVCQMPTMNQQPPAAPQFLFQQPPQQNFGQQPFAIPNFNFPVQQQPQQQMPPMFAHQPNLYMATPNTPQYWAPNYQPPNQNQAWPPQRK